jgi:hypothetical protein
MTVLHPRGVNDVLAMRDRIRSRGIQVMGPIDHGFIQSIYFAGPEGLSLEVCCGSDIPAEQWIDPEVQGLCGISAAELEALEHPASHAPGLEPRPNPPHDPAKPEMVYPPEVIALMDAMTDQRVWDRMSETTPPVPAD